MLYLIFNITKQPDTGKRMIHIDNLEVGKTKLERTRTRKWQQRVRAEYCYHGDPLLVLMKQH